MENGQDQIMQFLSAAPPSRSHNHNSQKVVPRRTYYYYAMVFDVEFESDDDTVFFAFSQPYHYTDIINLLLKNE
jgi:hypothetical protein